MKTWNIHHCDKNLLNGQKPSLGKIWPYFGPCPIHYNGGRWVYNIYCSQPPGGGWDILASLLGMSCRPSLSHFVDCLKITSIYKLAISSPTVPGTVAGDVPTENCFLHFYHDQSRPQSGTKWQELHVKPCFLHLKHQAGSLIRKT